MATRAAQRAENLGSTLPLHPLLFAAYPVIRLYGENLTEVTPAEVVLPLLVAVGATAVGLVVLTYLLHDARRAALITSAVILPLMSFELLLGLVEPILGEERMILLALCVAGIVVAVIVAWRAERRLASITLALNVISFVLLVLVAVPAARGVAMAIGDDGESSANVTAVAAGEVVPERDIYHFVLDRYGSERALEAGFGISNADFIAWLEDNRFQVVDEARANYAKTNLSMSATLGMSHLDGLAERMGPDSQNLDPVVRRIKQNKAGAFLQERGYEYNHVGSWFRHTRDSEIADRVYNPRGWRSLATTLYGLSVLPMLIDGTDPETDFKRTHSDAAEYQFSVLERIIERPGRKYVLAHILLPHPPYVFLEDGTYAPDEASFETQLADTNRRLKALLEPLLERPEEEQPIIIIQADEGPFPDRLEADEPGFDWATATDAELVTKYGIINAMYLPGPNGAAPLPVDMTAVNTYPEVFRRYFATDHVDEPNDVYASTKSRPYDLLNVTERLDAAGG